ncbi:hypothetical protein [Halopseudomonas pelagia]|uniref:hypothetical protein n=1 Tax=Halopseudomonas pelagia TaxID=553151 RepID=UPI0003A2365E|nr:hypothetical protein [Halopseudomonas pelagia]|tara:strand:+ start:1550 stop:1978 length:429 start_codon:yes stop_codon:yes gene_type:complete
MTSNVKQSKASLPGWLKAFFLIVLIVAMAAVIWTQLPRSGISTDLSVVGGDKPVLVLTRDVNFLNGAGVLDLLREMEPEYREAIPFRIAHQGQPAGQAFARKYQTQDGDLALIDSDGKLIGRMVQPQNSAEIAQLLPRPTTL